MGNRLNAEQSKTPRSVAREAALTAPLYNRWPTPEWSTSEGMFSSIHDRRARGFQ